jgi:NAD(P)-dependent dehydrogenase (short-subunit alcohol dehydrogenase family)
MKSYSQRTSRPAPRAIVMQNHGVFIGGESAEQIKETTDWLIDTIAKKVAAMPQADPFGPVTRLAPEAARKFVLAIGPALRGLLAEGDALKVVTFDDSDTVLSLIGSAEGSNIASAGPLSPDQIVYCKSFPLWFIPEEGESDEALVQRLRAAIDNHIKTTHFPPKEVLVERLGMFAVGDDYAGAATVAEVYTDAIKVMAGARRLGGIRHLPKRDREFIDAWEVEAYRRQVAAGSKKAGRASGKVAVVTGAAQGFGLEIAQDLAAQGAHVALTDLNAAGATVAAAELSAALGRGRATGLAVNVTSAASIAEMIYQVVRMYGGLDLFVSNAGVLKAGSVKTLPEKDFDFVTAVNYKGYFLCVHAAAPVMAMQHLARPGVWSDIIQINSKSGLEGSNKNGAYAGSKFGGIGLTQSFAMELVEDGIKVNSICPGNFFDGPLWSNPQNGLFVQYLRTGKVAGAKTVEDVKRAYESKVPMGRGCTTPDVMKAIYYLMEQVYETGQAIPVTGGQVMLK